jgi:hypothetical protein
MKILCRCFLVCGLFIGPMLPIPNGAKGAAPANISTPAAVLPLLASHKALYAVTLTTTRPGSDYLDVNGKMLLEFTDSCDVWTTNQKSILRTVTGEGAEELSNSDFNAVENKAGDSYVFTARQTQNGETSEFRGRAKRNKGDESGTVFYTKPDRKSYKLPPNFLFQTAQQVKLIEFAQKGGRFLNGDMFDGSEGGGAARFNALVLKPTVSVSSAQTPKNPLLDSPEHRVRVAFYPPEGLADGDSSQEGDNNEEPEYEMTMTVHDNGVVSEYDYDYQDFSVHGALISIQALPRPHC